MSLLDQAKTRSVPGDHPDLLTQVMERSRNGIVIVDARQPDQPIVGANPAFSRLSGYTLDEVLGRDYWFLHNASHEASASAVRHALTQQTHALAILPCSRSDGTSFPNQVLLAPVCDEAGMATHFVSVHSPVAPQACGTRLLRQYLDEAICIAAMRGHRAALFTLDVDHFKQINATLGYEQADHLLELIEKKLDRLLGGSGRLLRYGVDEFAFVVHHRDDASAIANACESIARSIAEPFCVGTREMQVSFSIGVACFPHDGMDADTMLRYSHIALQRAKGAGRNNIQFFSDGPDARLKQTADLGHALRAALAGNGLALHYQPLADLQTGRAAGLKALACWTHPVSGQIASAKLAAIAEECGMADELDEWLLRQVCADLRSWQDSGLADVRVAVNISSRRFRTPMLADQLATMIAQAGIPPQAICIEITEHALTADTAAVEATMARLQAIGIDLVLDDFRIGYASLAYLKRFTFAKVKIDRTFVENVATNSEDGAICSTIISMAHNLGIRVVAEGVDTEQQCDFLRRNMCDEIQGGLFSAPLPAEAMTPFLTGQEQLPSHLFRLQRPQRTLLLVDDEVNILASLKRLLRRDNYNIVTAGSGQEGLDLLLREKVDVILSDQRMPGMTGVEFLSKAKDIYPGTVRMVLSGYTELKSVTDAVNEGAIYKFLTKPWDDEQLRAHVQEAFQRKEMADENERLNLEVRSANFQLAAANRKLEEVLQQQQQQITRDEVSLHIVHEVLQQVPVPVVGLDEDAVIAFVNKAAQTTFSQRGHMLGSDASVVMPELLAAINSASDGRASCIQLHGNRYALAIHQMGHGSSSRGVLVSMTKE